MKYSFFHVRALVLFVCGLLTSCANHVKQETHTETEVERQQVAQSIDIDAGAGSLISAATFTVQVEESQSFKVKTYEAKTDYDLVTPYQGVRELYEFPLGIVLLPVGIVVNVLDAIPFFGMLPDKMTDPLLNWSFAGINPFLNIESEQRVERRLAKADKKLIDEKDEFLKKPLVGSKLEVSGGGAQLEYALDEHGKVEVSMIRLSALTNELERVSLTIPGEKAITRDYDLSRQLRSQLMQAALITRKYAALAQEPTAEVVQALDLAAFSADLVGLSRLGFESESLHIEKKALSLMPEEQKGRFRQELDRALATAAPGEGGR